MFRAKHETVPELSPPTLEYVAQAYIAMLDWIEGKGDPPFEIGDLEVPAIPISPGGPSNQEETNASLGACIALDVSFTGVRISREVSQPDSAELDRRSKLGELMVKGFEYDRVTNRRRLRLLQEPNNPYSPKLVAVEVSYGVQNIMGLTDESRYKGFMNHFSPHEWTETPSE